MVQGNLVCGQKGSTIYEFTRKGPIKSLEPQYMLSGRWWKRRAIKLTRSLRYQTGMKNSLRQSKPGSESYTKNFYSKKLLHSYGWRNVRLCGHCSGKITTTQRPAWMCPTRTSLNNSINMQRSTWYGRVYAVVDSRLNHLWPRVR